MTLVTHFTKANLFHTLITHTIMNELFRSVRMTATVLTATVLVMSVTSPSYAGIIIVNNDEWTLSNTGFATVGHTAAANFARNIASAFSGGTAGSFLVYSSDFGLTQSSLASTMTGAGYAWTINNSLPFTLANLEQYDGVFLGLNNPTSGDISTLAQYVIGGGNVYVMAGTGATTSDLA